MRLRFVPRARQWTVLSGLALAFASGSALAQEGTQSEIEQVWFRKKHQPVCPPPCVVPCPIPCPAPQLIQPPVTQPPTTPPDKKDEPKQPPVEAPQTPEPSADQQAGATLGETTAFAPNVIGDLLYGTRSVSFPYLRATGPVNVFTFGSTTVTNPSVAENNSPVPRDRAFFRFNYFNIAQTVSGLGPNTTFTPSGIGTAQPATKNYSVEMYTFGFEKTFLNQRASLELRVPFLTALSPHQVFSTGNIAGPISGTDPNGNPLFLVAPTPDNTLGSSATQWGNINMILKGAAIKRDRFVGSGGLAFLFPTGPDQEYRIIDYTSTPTSLNASGQRERTIHINNSTWAMSPFVAFLAIPTDRLFTQGFLQVDVPLNSSHITYSDRFTRGVFGFNPALTPLGPNLPPPIFQGRDIVDQPLMHINWATGYWVMRDPNANWLNGLAPIFELHYTTTLRNANIVQLPGDGSTDVVGGTTLVAEPGPQVGNLQNRLDILNLTAGATALVANRATVTTGFVFPLRQGDDRLFNWEFQLQLNYYFGSSRPSVAQAPNF